MNHEDQTQGVSLDLNNKSREQSEMASLDLNRLVQDKNVSGDTLAAPTHDVEANATTTKPEAAPLTPPDGGLRAWLQVAGGFFIFFNIWSVFLFHSVNEACQTYTFSGDCLSHMVCLKLSTLQTCFENSLHHPSHGLVQ